MGAACGAEAMIARPPARWHCQQVIGAGQRKRATLAIADEDGALAIILCRPSIVACFIVHQSIMS